MSKPIMDLAAAAKQAVPAITPEEVKPLLDRDDVLIVDVRDDNEVAESGKVKGAVHVSRGMLDFPPTRPRPFTTWRSPRTRRSFSICASGGRSALGGTALLDLGYGDVRKLGAFKDWVEVGGAVD